MIGLDLLIGVALGYVAVLFAVAWAADRAARRGRDRWLTSPMIYTLSLSIYCTAWTFYGAVGYAARSGLEYVTIYLGPTLVMVGWWWGLRKLVHVGRAQRITSIADLISARYGKSNLLGVLVTLLAVVGTTPYIALQLQSVVLSMSVFAGPAEGGALSAAAAGAAAAWHMPGHNASALWVAAGLALFTILFGTRNLDANERHSGVVMAIAVEAVVKLVALVAVGLFVVWGVAGGLGETLSLIAASPIAETQASPTRWAGLTFLAAAAFVTLPRMFQVLVVENVDARQLAVASWAFPLYLFGMSLFVVPIAAAGLMRLAPGANPDLFVLSLPLAFDQGALATLSFLGGFSSATSMVIVAAIALSTMVSNHVVMPLWLMARGSRQAPALSGDVRRLVLGARRVSIIAILALGYGYYRVSGGGAALAAIGLISFAGVAQVLPALVGGLFWRGATRPGALTGLGLGFLLWGWTLFLPSFGEGGVLSARVLAEGPWGLGWLRPQALFGIAGLDPLVHALTWSLGANVAGFVIVSLLTFPGPLERLQSAQFVHALSRGAGAGPARRGEAEAEDLLIMAQRIMGPGQAQALFRRAAQAQGKAGFLPDPTPDVIEALERELAGSVGAATAHAMIGQIVGGSAVSVDELMAMAGEAREAIAYSSRLEAQSRELGRTARQLAAANEKLTRLSQQKDAFLSQISHELRTPMTSIRAFSEILMSETDLPAPERQRYSAIIHDETIRLTRLLDDLLDLSVLEAGKVRLDLGPARLEDVLEAALAATSRQCAAAGLAVSAAPGRPPVRLTTDAGRLTQVFINLISNAAKYCDAPDPRLEIGWQVTGAEVVIDIIDNGSGIAPEHREVIFEKFSRLTAQERAGGAGLGLAIAREIAQRLGGRLVYLPGQGGAAFRLTLPLERAVA